MRPNKLRELLKSNKPTLSTHIHTTWPSVVEAIGHTGLYDYVEFVGEYGPFDLHDLDNLARAGGHLQHVDAAQGRPGAAGLPRARAIGSGFHSILFADCRSAADVQECVRIVRAETPEDGGTYGVATRRFTYMGYGGTKEYVQALRDIVVAIMIEKPGTVDTLEEVLVRQGCRHGAVGRLRLLDGHRTSRRALFARATSGGAPRVRNGHQDGRAAPRRDRHRGSGEVLPRHGRPALLRRHRHHRSCTSGGSPRVRTCARRSAAADSRPAWPRRHQPWIDLTLAPRADQSRARGLLPVACYSAAARFGVGSTGSPG